jgi:GNAT superfamily N-acetyltransferase
MESSAQFETIISVLASNNVAGTLPTVHIRAFQAGDETAFRELNEAWIAKYFTIEEPDRQVLNDPVGHIIGAGGYVFMAFADKVPVGCCALLPMEPGCFELAKMAVKEDQRGKGIGRKVLAYAIAQARKIGARRLYLETNRKLANAIHLYESVGFEHVSPDQVIPSPYARANVFMEMKL